MLSVFTQKQAQYTEATVLRILLNTNAEVAIGDFTVHGCWFLL